MANYEFALGGQLPLKRCPHCGVASPSIEGRWNKYQSTAHDGSDARYWQGYQCLTCGGMILAASAGGKSGKVTEMYPTAQEPDSALPARAQRFMGEAYESINTPSAGIMVAASAVDAMLKAKGLKDGSLYSRIDGAADDGLITADMAAWAHEVRLDANDQRHADEDAELPTPKDARRCVEFAEALGDFLFVLPARVTKGREKAEGEE